MAERIIDLSYLVCIIEKKFNSGGLTLKCQMIYGLNIMASGLDCSYSRSILGFGRIFVIGLALRSVIL